MSWRRKGQKRVVIWWSEYRLSKTQSGNSGESETPTFLQSHVTLTLFLPSHFSFTFSIYPSKNITVNTFAPYMCTAPENISNGIKGLNFNSFYLLYFIKLIIYLHNFIL